MSSLNQYKCPCCGGTLEFDIHSQSVTCPYCDAQFQVSDLKDLDNELQEKFEEKMEWGSEEATYSDEETQGMHVYRCDSCGGEIICDEKTASTSCPYCGNAVVMKGNLSGDLKPSYIIPFQLDLDKSKDCFRQYFKKKFFIPSAFKKENSIEETKTMYVPYFIFFADSYGKVTFDAKKTHRWSDSEYNYKETEYYRIYRYGDIAFDNIPVDASSQLADDLLESIEPFNYREHKEFVSAYLAGYTAERYDVEREVTEKRANQRIKEGTISALRNTVHGYEDVTLHDSAITLSNQSNKYVLYPLYFLNVKWREETYTFAVNGQTGKVAGRYPISKAKFALVLAIILVASFALFFGLGFLVANSDENDAAVPIGILIGAIGGIITTLISGIVIGKKLKKRVAFQTGAADYVRDNSFHLEYSRDQFLYRKVTRTRRSSSSSSSSSRKR